MPLQSDAPQIWSRLLGQARLNVSPDVYRTWLEPIRPTTWDDPVLTVSVPDAFSLEWTESKYVELLTSLAPVALGRPVSLKLQVDPLQTTRPQFDLFATTKIQEPPEQHQNDISATRTAERYTFDHFVVGKSNELAAAAAQAVADAPGRVYNPLFIYGSTGLGKTHLIQAIGHQLHLAQPAYRLAYLTSEQFTNEMIAAIQSRRTHEFRRRFRETDLLLVDDIHFLKGKEGTQEEFFHTFNALYEAGRQIVLTSDRPPAEIGGLESRLVSRFQWGMVADIQAPDLEHRIAILQHKVRQDYLHAAFPDDVLQFIAQSVQGNVRELEGAVLKVLAHASLRHQPVDLHLAQLALRDVTTATGPVAAGALTVDAIQLAVASVWHVTVDGMRSKARTHTLTVPRQFAMHIARTFLNTQLVEIGRAFGNRDHSTVIHSLARAQALLQHDPQCQEHYARALDILGLRSSGSGRLPSGT